MHTGIWRFWKDYNIFNIEIFIFEKHYPKGKKLGHELILCKSHHFHHRNLCSFSHVIWKETGIATTPCLRLWRPGRQPAEAWGEPWPLHFSCCYCYCGKGNINNANSQEQPTGRKDFQVPGHPVAFQTFVSLPFCFWMLLENIAVHSSPAQSACTKKPLSSCDCTTVDTQLSSLCFPWKNSGSGFTKERGLAFLCLGDKLLVSR